MAYAAWSVVAGEQPTAAKWNILGTNDASFNDGTGIGTSVLDYSKMANGFVVQEVSTNYQSFASGTTIMPFDNTIPQITEGDQYMTQAITPKSTTNTLIIEIVAVLSFSVATRVITGAIFQDATANALAVTPIFEGPVATAMDTLSLVYKMTAGTTSSTTFRFRAGAESAGTTTFSGTNGAGWYGGTVLTSNIKVTEIKA